MYYYGAEFGMVPWFLITGKIIQSGLGDRVSGSHWWQCGLMRVNLPILLSPFKSNPLMLICSKVLWDPTGVKSAAKV